MKLCPICHSYTNDFREECSCGFVFPENRECPKCKKKSEYSVLVCECGYDFRNDKKQRQEKKKDNQEEMSTKKEKKSITLQIKCKICPKEFNICTDQDYYAFNCPYCRSIYAVERHIGEIDIVLIKKGAYIPDSLKWATKTLCITDESITIEYLKSSWKKQIELYHPDKIDHMGIDLKAYANKKVIEINQAYDVLVDWISNKEKI